MGGGCAAIPADVRNPPKVDKSTGNLNAKLVRRKGSKRIPGEKKIQRIVKTYQVKSDGIACVLCGALIQKGKMLEHKAKVHGEREITPSVTPTRQRNVWVQILQGGLPGLGKRR
jgi:hypothetical protein